jgi:hypothetical protein
LHQAVWGKYGGRIGEKVGICIEDTPEIAEMLILAGASIEAKDH